MSGILVFAIVLGLLALRQNIIMVLAVLAAIVHAHVARRSAVEFLIQDIWFAVDREALLSIPMFLLAGAVMTRGTIAQRLIDMVIALTRPVPGGLAVACVLSCAAFAAISGSSVVTMLAIGTIMYPALIREGYDKKLALGAIASAGTLGIIIPPSIPLLLYGLITETSVVDLFTAGFGPGALLTLFMASYVIWMNRHRPSLAWRLGEIGSAFRRGIWSLMMPVILLGGIYSGKFTPTEAAAVSLFYALIVELFIHREMKPRDYVTITLNTVIMLGTVLPILAVASSLNNVIELEGLPKQLVLLMQQYITNGWVMMFAINILLLVVGCFMEVFSAIIIFTPILLPIVTQYGFDPVHFGIIMIVNLELGYLTPPVGLNIIVGSVAFKEPFALMVRAVIPFVAIMVVALAIIIVFAPLSLWLVHSLR